MAAKEAGVGQGKTMTLGSERQIHAEALEGCPVCGEHGNFFFEVRDRVHGVNGSFSYHRCESCGTVFQNPRVIEEELGFLYPSGYHTRVPFSTPEWSEPGRPGAGFRDTIRKMIVDASAPEDGTSHGNGLGRLLSRSRWLRERAFKDQVMDEMLPWRRPPGAALDVGCGAGKLLPRLAAVGWLPQGLEWDEEAASVAESGTGFPVHVGSADRVDEKLGPFDLITLVHVFEHLGNPNESLAHLKERLSPDGRIVLLYPNPESFLVRLHGEDWFGWEVPRHLSLLPIRALRRSSEVAGLRVRSARTLTRWTAALSWQSRALKAESQLGAARLLDPDPGIMDKTVAMLERVLVLAGRPMGEEVLAVLERLD